MSKSKTMLRVLCVVLSLVMALSVGGVKAQAADEKPSKYLSSSTLDVGKAFVGLTESQFNRKMQQDTTACSYAEGFGLHHSDSITFSENGYLTYKIIAKTQSYDVKSDLYIDSQGAKGYNEVSSNTAQQSFPVDGESTLFLMVDLGWNIKELSTWLNFVPMSQMIKMDYCEENEDGSYYFYVKNIADNIDHISVCAFQGDITAREAYLQKTTSELNSISTDNGAKIKLPKKGTYTLLTTVFTDDNSQMEFVQVVKTADYAKKSAKTLGKPIAAYAGTKVVIGKADPGATVSCTFNKNTKTTTADDSGLYIIELDKALKAKDKIVLWQKVGKMTGKKKTFKISK